MRTHVKTTVDTKDLETLHRNLLSVSGKAFPSAVRNMINKQAYLTSLVSKKKTIPAQFTNRSTFIRRTVRFQRSKFNKNINSLESRAGQVSSMFGLKTDQLKRQELGLNMSGKGTSRFIPFS